MAKRRDLRVDIVHANHNGALKVEPLAKCPMCPDKIKGTDAVVRIRNFDDINDPPITIHRRCLEATLEAGVEDVPKALSKFDRYRARLIKDLGLKPIG